MTITCTSTVRHGDTRLTATGTGVTREEALTAAVAATNIGYRPHPDNVRGALELVLRYHNGERPSASFVKSTNGHATMSLDHDGYPVIQIGWVDFTFTERDTEFVEFVIAQVRKRQEAEDEFYANLADDEAP